MPIRQDLYAGHALGHLIASVLGFLGTWFAVAAVMVSAALADEPKTYAADGWLARCDTTGCRASHASTAGSEAFLLARWKGIDGVAFGLATPHAIADRDRPLDLRIDDKLSLTLRPAQDYAALEHIESFWVIDTATAAKLASALASAKTLRISYLDMVGAPHDADFTLDGLAGTTAFLRETLGAPDAPLTGVAPPKSLAPPPAASRIDLIREMGVPDRLLARHRRVAVSCDDPDTPRLKTAKPIIGALSKVAILYAIPCITAPNGTAYRIWVIETGEIGGITPQYFALYDPKFGWKGSELVYNVGFDEASGQLSSTAPRDATACGHYAVWVWKDYAFALQSYELTPACPGAHAPKIYPGK